MILLEGVNKCGDDASRVVEVPGTRTPRPRMVWNKPHNKAIGFKACALTADEGVRVPGEGH